MVTDNGGIDEAIRSFLQEHIRSYEDLEALLLLRARSSTWEASAVAEALNLSEEVARETLEHLRRRGLSSAPEHARPRRYGYQPATAGLAQAVDMLAQAYEERRVAVMRLMSENAIARMRTSASRAFADAFVLGRRKGDDG